MTEQQVKITEQHKESSKQVQEALDQSTNMTKQQVKGADQGKPIAKQEEEWIIHKKTYLV